MKALVGAFNQENPLVGAFSVIVKTGCGTDGSFYSTILNTTNVVKDLEILPLIPDVMSGMSMKCKSKRISVCNTSSLITM